MFLLVLFLLTHSVSGLFYAVRMTSADLNCRRESNKPYSTHIDVLSFNIWDSQLNIPGALDLSLSFNTTKSLSSNVQLSTKLHRKLGPSWIHIPCLTGIGTCDKQLLCDLIRQKCKKNHISRSNQNNLQKACSCKLDPGTHTIEHISLPIMRNKSAKLVRSVTSGQYRFQVTFLNEANSQIGCVIGYLTLSKSNHFT